MSSEPGINSSEITADPSVTASVPGFTRSHGEPTIAHEIWLESIFSPVQQRPDDASTRCPDLQTRKSMDGGI